LDFPEAHRTIEASDFSLDQCGAAAAGEKVAAIARKTAGIGCGPLAGEALQLGLSVDIPQLDVAVKRNEYPLVHVDAEVTAAGKSNPVVWCELEAANFSFCSYLKTTNFCGLVQIDQAKRRRATDDQAPLAVRGNGDGAAAIPEVAECSQFAP